MKPDVLLELLEATAESLSIRVSYELLSHGAVGIGHGGLCRVKGQYRVIIDKRATPQERVNTLAGALANFDTSGITVHNKVRDILAFHSSGPTRKAS
jgi:hypothetical protein